MAAKATSELVVLLTLLRRIIVMGVAAFGLMRGMPYLPLLARLAILWGVLYICSGMIDVIFRRLSYRAMLRDQMQQGTSTASSSV
jgi:hypothetical protein